MTGQKGFNGRAKSLDGKEKKQRRGVEGVNTYGCCKGPGRMGRGCCEEAAWLALARDTGGEVNVRAQVSRGCQCEAVSEAVMVFVGAAMLVSRL